MGFKDDADYTKHKKFRGHLGKVTIRYVSGHKRHGFCSVRLYVRKMDHSSTIKAIQNIKERDKKWGYFEIEERHICLFDTFAKHFFGRGPRK